MDKAIFSPGKPVRVSGIYVSAGGRRMALAVGELFPHTSKGTGWMLEERIGVERASAAPGSTRPLLIDEAAMEYVTEASWTRGWNSALRALEAKLLTAHGTRTGRFSKAEALDLIAELRLERVRMAADGEGDLEDDAGSA